MKEKSAEAPKVEPNKDPGRVENPDTEPGAAPIKRAPYEDPLGDGP